MSDRNEPLPDTTPSSSPPPATPLSDVLSDLDRRWSDPTSETSRAIERNRVRFESAGTTIASAKSIEDSLSYLRRSIGLRYANCTLTNFHVATKEQRDAVAKVELYLASLGDNVAGGNSLIFYGPCGSGKDHLMAAAMMFAIERGYNVHWHNGLDWYGRVRDNIDRTESFLRELITPSILAISDPVPPAVAGTKADGDLSSWRIELLQRVVDGRYRACRPTWITINVTGRQGLYERLSAPLADRLMDGAVGVQLVAETARQPQGAHQR